MISHKRNVAIRMLLGVVVLLALTGAKASDRDRKPSTQAVGLEGLWEVTVLANGQPPVVDLATFTKDGTVVNIDPDPNLSAGIGTFSRRPGDRFACSFTHFLSDHGSPIGRINVRATVGLDAESESFTGPFRTDVVINGQIVQSVCGTVEARRVTAEEIEPCP
jgi:hypothetical protein